MRWAPATTKIVLSGDLDEYAIAALRAEPVDVYGVGTSLVTGSGAPTAGMVYKMVEVDGRPVAKRSENKQSNGGAKGALRRHRATGTATEEVVYQLSGRAARRPSRATWRCRFRWSGPGSGWPGCRTAGRTPGSGSPSAGHPAVGGAEAVAGRPGHPDHRASA